MATLLAPLGLAAGTAGTLLFQARRSLPQVTGRLTLPELEWPVDVVRDRWGVPHIRAETQHDLFLAQGFVLAQDRFWQLELNRRLATGRLSELVGRRALSTDRFLRRLGFARIARREAEHLDPEERAVIQAYADGVNAYLAHHRNRLPPEFLLLSLTRRNVSVDPWQVTDSLAFAKYLAWILSPNWDNQLIRAQLIASVGLDAAAAVDPLGDDLRQTSVPAGLDFGAVDWNLGFEPSTSIPNVGAVGQSNAWAVSGDRATSGYPLLANDAHLRASQPVIWYEVHLRGADFEVAGLTLPGVPGIVAGHNRQIAWGITASLVDVQDLVVERFDSADPERYAAGEGWAKVDRLTESIGVAGYSRPIEESVRLTRHGPILNPADGAGSEFQIALRSTVFEPAHLARSLLALNRAGTWDEFRAALADWAGPCLTFVYGDRARNVGLQVAGWVPRRGPAGDTLVPSPGWDAAYDWQGFLPFDELPREFNPDNGYCANANNALAGPDFPHRLTREWTDDYRIRRIRETIESRRQLTRGACRELQIDCRSEAGLALTRSLDGLPATGRERAAIDLLRRWDGEVRQRSPGAALYEVFRAHLLRRLIAAPSPDFLRDQVLGRGLHPVLNPVNTLHIRFGSTIVRRLQSAQTTGWPEPAADPVRQALRDAWTWLSERLGEDPAAWEWGKLHRLTFTHPFGDRPLLDRFLNIGPSPVDGDSETVMQTGLDWWEPYEATGWTPSYRLIVDLGDFDRSISVLPTGQSGHPFSRHYRDQHALFVAGRYHPMPFSDRAVEQAAACRLTLTPVDTQGRGTRGRGIFRGKD